MFKKMELSCSSVKTKSQYKLEVCQPSLCGNRDGDWGRNGDRCVGGTDCCSGLGCAPHLVTLRSLETGTVTVRRGKRSQQFSRTQWEKRKQTKSC